MLFEITVTLHVSSSTWAALVLILLLANADAPPRALSLPGGQARQVFSSIPVLGSRHRRRDVPPKFQQVDISLLNRNLAKYGLQRSPAAELQQGNARSVDVAMPPPASWLI